MGEDWRVENLSEIRKRRGLYQETLAHRAGVRQQTISRYEHGTLLSRQMSRRLAPVLGMDSPSLWLSHNLCCIRRELEEGMSTKTILARILFLLDHVDKATTPEQKKALKETLAALGEEARAHEGLARLIAEE